MHFNSSSSLSFSSKFTHFTSPSLTFNQTIPTYSLKVIASPAMVLFNLQTTKPTAPSPRVPAELPMPSRCAYGTPPQGRFRTSPPASPLESTHLTNLLYGDGIAFFIVPYDSRIPPNSTGGFLGLFSSHSAFDTSKNHVFAVEFDSKQDDWDSSDNHIGININSINSTRHLVWNTSMKDNRTANAWITYNSFTKNLSVYLTYVKDPVFTRNVSISTTVDLKTLLPERVRIGFSAATGNWFQIHNIISWTFDSTLEDNIGGGGGDGGGDNNKNIGLAIGIGVGLGVLICGLSLFGFLWWRRQLTRRMEDVEDLMDDEFERGTGPKRFTYRELAQATKNFDEAANLGKEGLEVFTRVC